MSAPRQWSSSIASVIRGLGTSSSNQTTSNSVADSSTAEEELVDFSTHAFSTLHSKLEHQERLVDRIQTQFEKYASEAAEGHTEEDFQSRMSKLVEARAELDRIKEALEARMLHGMDLGNELIPHLIYLLDITASQAVAVGPGSYLEKSTSEMTRILVQTREVEKDVGRDLLWLDDEYLLLTTHDRSTPIAERIRSLVQAQSDINRGS
ncbi:hypothetical protein EHS25_009205 [Saitozyma podzolica]|uniref:Uncharacterized protein n=1 Tax=Saitozyma podzolica TaxID=1890683 RepID=A0A427YL55_9TREE|nr:hypothetical protein EHS25_009205 [Saitozyma podzolica]